MEKKKIFLIFGISIVIAVALFFVLKGEGIKVFNIQRTENNKIMKQVSFDPFDSRDIGYEFLNLNGEVVPYSSSDVVHIWNNKDDYFFNVTSGIQFTNHFNDYWTHNVFCGGYKNSSNDWIYNCNDALPFIWNIKSDNSTYVNITGYRDITISGRTVRAAIRYHLKLDDENLSIQLSAENIGDTDVPVDLGFAWRVNDIRIRGTETNDMLGVNGTQYNLHDSLDLSFTELKNNLSAYSLYEGELFLDGVDYVRLDWDNNLNYMVVVEDTPSQYNAPVTLGINVGTLAVGQQKTTTLYWRDPTEEFFENCAAPPASLTDTWIVVSAGGAGDQWQYGSGGDSGLCWATEQAYGNMTTINAIDISAYAYANLSFDYNGVGVDAGSDFQKVYVNSSADAWQLLGTFDDDHEGSFQYNISSYLTSTTGVHIRAECKTNVKGEDCRWDNINLTGYGIVYGTLDIVDISYPINNTNFNQDDSNFTITANVSCIAPGICGIVYAYARYNVSSATPNMNISKSGGEPFFITSKEERIGENWSIIDDEGDGVGGFTPFYIVGDDSSNNVYNSTIRILPTRTINVTEIILYTTNFGNDYLDSGDVQVFMCTDFNACTRNGCTLVNSTWDPIWDDGPQTISLNQAYLMEGNQEYALAFGTMSTDGSGTADIVRVDTDNSATEYTIAYFDGSCHQLTNYANVILNGTEFLKNPLNSESPLSGGQSFLANFTLTITSSDQESYLIDVLFKSSYGSANVSDNDTADIQIHLNPSGEAPPDTCTYSSGNWNIECDDACTITSNVDGGGNDFTAIGSGILVLNANITNFVRYHISGGCQVLCLNGCINYMITFLIISTKYFKKSKKLK